MTEKADKAFFLVNKQGQMSDEIRLAYGAGVDDTPPFFLFVGSTYVASKLDKQTVKYSDMDAYVDSHAEELRQTALTLRNKGLVTYTLT